MAARRAARAMVVSLAKPRVCQTRTADARRRGNPEGSGAMAAWRRHSSFIWNNQISLLVPCPATIAPTSRLAPNCEQTLAGGTRRAPNYSGGGTAIAGRQPKTARCDRAVFLRRMRAKGRLQINVVVTVALRPCPAAREPAGLGSGRRHRRRVVAGSCAGIACDALWPRP